MKLLSFIIFLTSLSALGGTCTSISRSNYVANTVLTSSALNLDFNTVYTAVNAFDGGCVTDGTLELSALNTSDFAALLDGGNEGCFVSRSDAATFAIGPCRTSVNGSLVATTTTTTTTWGCTGCASEATGTLYYVYIKDGSTGTTLTPLISTTAPNSDGYDNSNNKVVGKIYNDSAGDLEDGNAGQWIKNKFVGFKNYIRVRTNNGFGSADTKIRLFSTLSDQIGDIGYSATAGNGSVFTINSDGIYNIVYCDAYESAISMYVAITVNSAQLTTDSNSLSDPSERRAIAYAASGNPACASWEGFLNSGDIVRPHGSGTPGTASNKATFSISSKEF